MSRMMLYVAAAAALALAGSAQAQAAPPPPDQTVAPAPPTTNPPMPPTDAGAPPSQPGDLGPNAAATPGVAVGVAVKDKTGALIGKVLQIKPDGTGKLFATIDMGASGSFAVDASSLQMADGAATINMTQADILASIKKPA